MLGPLEVRVDDRLVSLSAAKPRAVLTLLLLHANEVVSVDRLIEALWPEQPPSTAANALQGYVSRLRKTLGSDRVETRPPGYSLRVEPDELDLIRFQRRAARGAELLAEGNAQDASRTLEEALALWRGDPLAEFAYEQFAQTAIARLEEVRLAALEERIEADLALGRHTQLVAELEGLVASDPLRERLRAQLMLALYRAGRQADALAVYQKTRTRLIEELGIEPSPVLQQLEREILMQDPALELGRGSGEGLPTGRVTLVFTDIESSTRLLQELSDDYADVLGRYRHLVRAAVRAHDGHEIDRQGDGFLFAFESPADAVAAAVAAQRALADERWPGDQRVRVRIGMHTGEPRPVEGGYVGVDVHRAARICAAAHGGQVVLSGETRRQLSESVLARVGTRDLGSHRLRDLPDPEALHQLEVPGLASDFPPLRVEGTEPAPQPIERSILVIPDGPSQLHDLLTLGESLARGREPHELIVARLVDADASELLARTTKEVDERRRELERRGVAVRIAAFTSADRAADTIRLGRRSEVDFLLHGAPERVVQDGQFGDDLTRVLSEAPSDVGVWINRLQLAESAWVDGPVLVPFGGAEHDWAALEVGAWFARAAEAPLRLLGANEDSDSGRRDASRLLADAALLIQRAAGVVPQPALVGPGRTGVVEAAKDGGLLVVGISERWAHEGLGMTRWGIAKTANAPVLVVRRGLRPGGLAPPASVTRFTWSVTRITP